MHQKTLRTTRRLMRWLTTAALLPSLAACVTSRTDTRGSAAVPSTPSQAVQAGLGLVAGVGSVDPEVVLKAMEDAAAGASEKEQKEREVLGMMRPLLARWTRQPGSLADADLDRLSQAIEAAGRLEPKSFERQLQTVLALDALELSRLGASMATEGNHAPGALSRASALAAAFPDAALAHSHKARQLAVIDGQEAAAMQSYARCLTLDRQNRACKIGLEAMADEWRRPRCAGMDPAKFSAAPAWPESSPGGRKAVAMRTVKIDGAPMMVETKPVLTGADVESLLASPGTGNDRRLLQVRLTPLAAARFAVLTRRLAEEGGHLAVRVGNNHVTAPRVMTAIDSGVLQIEAPAAAVARLCKTMQARPLPPGVDRWLKPDASGKK